MIRKQIFIDERQNEELKRLAKKTGKSEGLLLREAVQRHLAEEQNADALWEALIERWSQFPASTALRTWTRDELYEERLGRSNDDIH